MVPPETGGDVAGELAALATRLEQARFTTAFRGFEPREVHALLADVVARLKSLTRASPDGVVSVDNEALHARRVGAAEDEAAEIVRAAREEAERLLDEAMRQAAELRREAALFREEARASVLEGIRDANLLIRRARDERRPKDG